MTERHIYLSLQNELLAPECWSIVQATVESLPVVGDLPFDRLQKAPTSKDGQQIIYEATFDEEGIALSEWRKYIADAARVAQASVSIDENLVVMAGVGSTLLRFMIAGQLAAALTLFGLVEEGVWPTWEASMSECRQFIADRGDIWAVMQETSESQIEADLLA